MKSPSQLFNLHKCRMMYACLWADRDSAILAYLIISLKMINNSDSTYTKKQWSTYVYCQEPETSWKGRNTGIIGKISAATVQAFLSTRNKASHFWGTRLEKKNTSPFKSLALLLQKRFQRISQNKAFNTLCKFEGRDEAYLKVGGCAVQSDIRPFALLT